MKAENVKQVAVVGAGYMGAGIAIEFARFGYPVRIYNTNENGSRRAMARAREDLHLMAEMELLTAEEADAAYGRLQPTTDLLKAATGADYVIESAPEILPLKQDIFSKLDEACPPPAILATNTSYLRITDIARPMKHPERALVTHYFGPPHFIPLVEVVKGEKTDPQIAGVAAQVLRGLRKKVILLNVELVGHGANRIQNAMAREIQDLVDNGIPPTAVDELITYGFGRRLPFIGYFERMDIVGIDGRLERYVAAGMKPWTVITEKVKRGELGVKTGKGFHEWPGNKAEQLDRRLNMELIRLMKQDMERGKI